MKHETSIYIVEDELLIAANLKDQLIRAGFMFLGMSTRGEEALKEIMLLREQNQSPEIVLMDVCLRGEKDGIETARLLCEITDCAIIFLTGQSSREVYERSFHVKPFGYVLKPYDLEQTIMTIEIAAYQRRLVIENREMRIRLETLLEEKTQERNEVFARYEAVVGNTLMGTWIIQNKRVVFTNKAMSAITGYSMDEIYTFRERELENLIHPEDLPRLLMLTQKRFNGNTPPQHTLFRLISKSGEIRHMKSFVSLIHYNTQPAIHQTFLDTNEYQK